MLNQNSGLLGISGISGDMREILTAMKQRNARAKLAFDIYMHRLQGGIGAMAAVLGGMDVLVFTAGIGENSPEVRYATCSKLEFLGLELDEALDSAPFLDQDIAALTSRTRILVIRAQEDWQSHENVGRWQREPLLFGQVLTFPNKEAEHPIALVNHH